MIEIREMKFRIFDCISKKMVYLRIYDIHFYEIMIKKGSAILMQFTGLYDRDGNEIYEGDLLKPLYYTLEQGKYLANPKEVTFRGGRYFIGNKSVMSGSKYERYGNIFERGRDQ